MTIFRRLMLSNKFEPKETQKLYYKAKDIITISNEGIDNIIISNDYNKDTQEGIITCMSDIKYIGNYIFSKDNNNVNLLSIIIPDTVTSIGYKSFYGCNSLQSVNIPKNVVNVSNESFSKCTGDIYIDCDIKSQYEIATKVFTDSIFDTVTFGNNVTTINNSVLADCTINNLIISKSVQKIQNQYDQSSTNLSAWTSWHVRESILVDENNNIYKSEENCLIEKSTNILIRGCKNSIIPNYITRIESFALSGEEYTNLIIPDNIEKIDMYAFWNAGGSIIVNCDLINSNHAFFKSYFDVVDLSDNVTTIPNKCFSKAEIKKIIFSESLTTVMFGAFDLSTIEAIDLTRFETVPNTWENTSINWKYIVRDELYDEFVSHSSWSSRIIVKASEYTETQEA